jgi:hypothetical protein
MTDPGRNRLVSNNDVNHSSDAGWFAIVDVKFRLRSTVSAPNMIKIAGH